MTRTHNRIVGLLVVLAALDVASASLMPGVKGSAKPPTPAIVATWVFAALTLAAAYSLPRGARWARPVIYLTCALRVISGLLGVGDSPGGTLVALGVAGVVLSLAAIAILLRTRRQVASTAVELA